MYNFSGIMYRIWSTCGFLFFWGCLLIILEKQWKKCNIKKCISGFVIALLGMVLVSGVVGGENTVSATGMLFGVGAAVLYASIILLNKKLKDISANDTTIAQLGISAVVVGVYVLVTEDFSAMALTGNEALLLVVVGIVHTGIAYALYFGAVKSLKAQTAAIFSYIDPVFAIILSALFLNEPMTVMAAIGAVLILGSTLVSELTDK